MMPSRQWFEDVGKNPEEYLKHANLGAYRNPKARINLHYGVDAQIGCALDSLKRKLERVLAEADEPADVEHYIPQLIPRDTWAFRMLKHELQTGEPYEGE